MDKTSSKLTLYPHHQTPIQAHRETIATYRDTVHGNPKCNCGRKDMSGRQSPRPETTILPILDASADSAQTCRRTQYAGMQRLTTPCTLSLSKGLSRASRTESVQSPRQSPESSAPSVIPAKAGIQRNAEPPTTPCAPSLPGLSMSKGPANQPTKVRLHPIFRPTLPVTYTTFPHRQVTPRFSKLTG